MSSTAEPPPENTEASLADAVRLQLLLRALPGQRHDVLGPLSSLRMNVALLKRRVAGDEPDLEDVRKRVGELESRISDVVQAVALLRVWDVDRHELQGVTEVVEFALTLMRSAFSMKGHRIEWLPRDQPPDEPATAQCKLSVPGARYAVLGLLAHALDVAQVPTAYALHQLSDRLLMRGRALEDGTLQGSPVHGGLRIIDRALLDSLMADIGWALSGDLQCGLPCDLQALWPEPAQEPAPAS